jgi:glycosyltransferase involved in cell wall biosynthesis
MKTKSKEPKVSVIVAVYNQERFIGRCLRSLLHQSMPHSDYEIIVIDDGSTDRTAYALELFCDPSESVVRVVRSEKNGGLPAAINKGMREAKAPFVVRVDSDDFVNFNFLNVLSYYLDSNEYADAVACDYLLLDDLENVLERGDSKQSPIACGIMFRKHQLFQIGLYDENFRYHEERELRLRFEGQYTIHHLELPLYRYRRHENNITNHRDEMEKYRKQLIEKHGEEADSFL